MNLHQFRFVDAAVRNGLNLTAAARSLNTSQPGVSKAIIELENELGIKIFVRHGKRIKRVTEPGQYVVESIATILREVGNLRRIGEEYKAEDAGTLSIATTHSQARYVLPRPVAQLRSRYPQVNISMHQGTPAQVAQMVTDEIADIGIATEALSDFRELITLPCYEWQHVLIMPADHPLAQLQPLTLEAIAELPLVTYDPSFTGRKRIDNAFAQRGLTRTSSRPTCGLVWAWASWRRCRSMPRSTATSWRDRWARSWGKTSRASHSSATPTCAISSTILPSCCRTDSTRT